MRESRRRFLTRAGALPLLARWPETQSPTVEVRPTALYGQPDGRANLVRVTVTGLDAPGARARLTDRHGALAGTAGLLPSEDGLALRGEVWVALPGQFQVDVEVGRRRVARARARLAPPRRWTLFLLSTMHTDVRDSDLEERGLEVHRRNLDAALARLATHPDYRWTPECALQVLNYVENRAPEAGTQLVAAIRDGKVGFPALFANMLAGLLDHETAARLAGPAGRFAREHGLGFTSALLTDVPGAPATLPTLLAASGVRYLASAVNPERALPLLSPDEARRLGLAGEWTTYPQIYWWEGPDGTRVLHWRGLRHGDAMELGFADGADVMAQRLTDWLLAHPVLLSADYPYDCALLYGVDPQGNAAMPEEVVANVAEFGRRYAFPRVVTGRTEDFLRELERRHGPRIPVRRGDTGTYREDGAAAAARELAEAYRIDDLHPRIRLLERRLKAELAEPRTTETAPTPPAVAKLSDDELERFARHIVLPQVGGVGQRRLKAASVAIVGAGGIGSAVIPALAGAGLGKLTIIGKHLGLATSGTIVRTDDKHLVVTLGLKDCIVVHTPRATLVANKHDEEKIRQIVKELEQRVWDEYL